MENATTVLVPVGDFTADIARKVTRSLANAASHGRSVVISLEWTARWSWGALCELAESLRGRFRGTRVAFACVSPTGRALLREVGLGSTWIIADAPTAAAARHVRITAER